MNIFHSEASSLDASASTKPNRPDSESDGQINNSSPPSLDQQQESLNLSISQDQFHERNQNDSCNPLRSPQLCPSCSPPVNASDTRCPDLYKSQISSSALFLVEYEHNGRPQGGVSFWAENWRDARERLESIKKSGFIYGASKWDETALEGGSPPQQN